MENAFRRELENVVVEGAREKGYGLVAKPEVVFETEEGMKRGDLRIEAELSEGTGPPPEDLRARPEAPSDSSADGGAVLVDGSGKEWRLDRDTQVIGRLAGSEIELQDTGASRRHAEVRRRGQDFVIVDLGSTNGTLVNDSPIAEHTLEDGDRITIGRTVLEFRRP
jgi:hypothetical protein